MFHDYSEFKRVGVEIAGFYVSLLVNEERQYVEVCIGNTSYGSVHFQPNFDEILQKDVEAAVKSARKLRNALLQTEIETHYEQETAGFFANGRYRNK